MKRTMLGVWSAAVVVCAVGCASTQEAKKDNNTITSAAGTSAAADNAPASPASTPSSSKGGSVSAGVQAPSSPIYFAFDSDQLTSESQGVLRQMADYLRANPTAVLTVEGHCDETGSNEYNLALGDRRASAARGYLRALGVDDTRIKAISYGEERPAVAGNDDEAHAKNRRGQFDLKAG